jgi:CubicO group peptidase (beta-lactamase class C family)
MVLEQHTAYRNRPRSQDHWLNAGSASNPANRRWPSIPRDAYQADGFQEQKVIIVPSRKLVLVRLGNCSYGDAWNDEKFISEVPPALPKP